MKKLLALTLALVLALSLAACGGNGNTDTPSGANDNTSTPGTSQGTGGDETSDPGNETGLALSDINTDNWQEVVKSFAGIEVSLPAGWTITSAEGGASATLKFEGAETAAFDSFVETVFGATKAVATSGPYSVMGSHPYDAFTDAMTADTNLEKTYQWIYELSDSFMDVRNIKLRLADGVCELYLM